MAQDSGPETALNAATWASRAHTPPCSSCQVMVEHHKACGAFWVSETLGVGSSEAASTEGKSECRIS